MSSPDFPVVLYARVSRVRDERHKSVDDQLRELRAWAAREGWRVYDEHRDDDVSASRFARGKQRDGWQGTMDDLGSGRVRALLAWESSRTTRDKKVFAALEETCRLHRVLYGFSGQLYDLATSEGEFQVGLRNLLDIQESAKISERVQRAVNSRAADGRPHGAVQFGYRRLIDQRTGAVLGREEDPGAAPVVREIVQRVLARESGKAIADDLNTRGLTGAQGGLWTSTSVSKIAQNPAYAGLRVHHGEVVPDVRGNWPALINLDDHQRVVALFRDPERDKFRGTTKSKHLGTGIFRCGAEGCDGRMRAMVTGGRQNRYGCRACMKVSRAQAPVDACVEDHVLARLAAPDLFSQLLAPDDAATERRRSPRSADWRQNSTTPGRCSRAAT